LKFLGDHMAGDGGEVSETLGGKGPEPDKAP
jgi:hypothetical protein